ncbi:uncharacterized protein N7511_006860 [Penicillium nucicola]|uniref:uncharacterized protein n=1 Tax=Penicillium nucicola TaxID=1850975 RepID=UPI0025452F60|nr:uncharacterized protein N7511_006860 [Penicillium nucicola]KAJ5758166.1 hypothetical protein N7511_006860 [Penicillium nucicola]
MAALGPNNDLCFHRDPSSFPTPPEYNDWDSMLAQCQAPEDILYPSVESCPSDRLYAESLLDQGVDPNLNLNPDLDLYLDPSLPASSASYFPISTFDDQIQPVFNAENEHHEPALDYLTLPDYLTPTTPQNLSTPPFEIIEPGLPQLATPPDPTTCSGLTKNGPLCIITATQCLRSLHIPLANCISHQNGPNTQDRPKSPRMSGAVLKCNKEAGMAVCSMLQCGCSLRPQNQLLLAIICSRLISWYRAMIRTCYLGHSSQPRVDGAENDFVSPEKVVHQLVTIGDHSVDDQALGRTIQAQVTLGELRHMQRLVETLSLRILETANAQPTRSLDFAADAQVQLAGLPGPAHDRMVGHLLEEVHAAKADLISGLVEA